ncbi:MAG: hypothetical protein ACI8S6_000502 [Myxococcota bacterium]|jgi:hypothetical protein
MRLFVRVFWLAAIWAVASVGWLTLGGVMGARSSQQQSELYGKVADLWGAPQRQQAPQLRFGWDTQRVVVEQTKDAETGHVVETTKTITDHHEEVVHLSSSDIDVSLNLDQRRKGLLWFPLYDVDFSGAYTYTHRSDQVGILEVLLPFPDSSGLYDAFRFSIDGVADAEMQPEGGMMRERLVVQPGQEVKIAVGYRSRGMTEWMYQPSQEVSSLNDFSLSMVTDFKEIDFPAYTLSPSRKASSGGGWALGWDFDRVVTGHGIGMVMPEPIQPGPLAEHMAFSAPISLGFYFLILFVISVLRRIDIHPINYTMIAGAFFSFHLLLGYSADRLPIEVAFGLASVVSVLLVVSYLRLVVSSTFAFGPAAAAQLVYLVGFGLAHFWEGYTGLTVTVLSILTLFVLMQLTGRIDWDSEFRKVRQQSSQG